MAGICSTAIPPLSCSWPPATCCWHRWLHGAESAQPLDGIERPPTIDALSSRREKCDVVSELAGRALPGVEVLERIVKRTRRRRDPRRDLVVDSDDLAGSLADVGEIDDYAGD